MRHQRLNVWHSISYSKKVLSYSFHRPAVAQAQKTISVSASVTPVQIERMRSLAKVLSFKLELKFSSKTTHLIVASNEDKIAPEEVVFYEALMTGVWIVTWDWMEQSARCEALIDEEEFSVVGTRGYRNGAPELSRNNELKQLPRLFKGFNVYLEGQFGPPYPSSQDLAKILKAGGANILTRKPDPEAIPEDPVHVPFHVPTENFLARCSHIIIYQEGGIKEPELKYNMSHVKSLPALWLFECIKNFKIVDDFF